MSDGYLEPGVLARIKQAQQTVLEDRNDWWRALLRLREPLSPPSLVDAWIVGLRSAGIDAERARGQRPGSKWTTTFEFVIAFPCPFWHRTDDRTGVAKTALLVDDDGWVEVFEESCPACDWKTLTKWLVTCPLCEWDEDSAEHPADHMPLALASPYPETDDGEGGVLGASPLSGDRAPLAFVIAEFRRQARLARARWMIATDGFYADEPAEDAVRGALLDLALDALPLPSAVVSKRVKSKAAGSGARKGSKVVVVKENEPRTEPKPEREQFTEESGRAWLDERGIPFSLGVQALWHRIKEAEPDPLKRPPRALIEAMKRAAARSS